MKEIRNILCFSTKAFKEAVNGKPAKKKAVKKAKK